MKVLHTSDFHIGRILYKKKRYDELRKFFDWLYGVINQENIVALLITGDIFDNMKPSGEAQKLYYDFLDGFMNTCCRHVVIITGNHDSPDFFNAPKKLLKRLNIHLVARTPQKDKILHDGIIILRDDNGEPELIICCIPWIRDHDIEDADKKNFVQGVRDYYDLALKTALEVKSEMKDVPLIFMGHINADYEKGKIKTFSELVSYSALGHIHTPGKLGSSENIRYAGAPIAKDFSEADEIKSVTIFTPHASGPAEIKTIEIPVFQRLKEIQGDLQTIKRKIDELGNLKVNAWLKLNFTNIDNGEMAYLQKIAEEMTKDYPGLEVIYVHCEDDSNESEDAQIKLDVPQNNNDETALSAFIKCLTAWGIPSKQQKELIETYKRALRDEYSMKNTN